MKLKNRCKFILLNFLLLLALLLTFFTLFEPQELYSWLILADPIFVLIGIAFFILDKDYAVPIFNKILPFIIMVIFTIPSALLFKGLIKNGESLLGILRMVDLAFVITIIVSLGVIMKRKCEGK